MYGLEERCEMDTREAEGMREIGLEVSSQKGIREKACTAGKLQFRTTVHGSISPSGREREREQAHNIHQLSGWRGIKMFCNPQADRF